MEYDNLSVIYDLYNNGFDHRRYLDKIKESFRLPEAGLCLDCGCGTGSLLCELYRDGYDCTGVDESPEMLDKAREKLEASGITAHLVCQDITRLDLFGAYNVIFCSLDTINHICTVRGLSSFFNRLYNFTEPDGLFIFDVKTKAAFEKSRGVSCYETEQGAMMLEGSFGTSRASYDITFFIKKDNGLYERLTDYIEERFYDTDTLKKCICAAGFSYEGRARMKDRIIFAARKRI